MGGASNGLEQSIVGIISIETQESPDELGSFSPSSSFQLLKVARDGFAQSEQLLLVG
jgi:hypothetical protein